MERLCIMIPGEKVDYDDLYPIIDIEDAPWVLKPWMRLKRLRQAKSIFERNFIRRNLKIMDGISLRLLKK